MIQIDLGQVAREVALPLDRVQVTVELLDDGNTVPFVTRYRKDQTGGLDEEQIRRIQEVASRLRILTDRKQRILKSLETQGRATTDLVARIQAADSLRRLEDLYLPFKPKKQTLAGLARSRGLDPLAHEIVAAQSAVADLEARAAEFVNAEKGMPAVADVLQGAGHLVAEIFSENYPLRDELRELMKKTGKLVSTRIEEAEQTDEPEDGPADEEESQEHSEIDEDEDTDEQEHGEQEHGEAEHGEAEHSEAEHSEAEHGEAEAAGEDALPEEHREEDTPIAETTAGEASAAEAAPAETVPDELAPAVSDAEPIRSDSPPAGVPDEPLSDAAE